MCVLHYAKMHFLDYEMACIAIVETECDESRRTSAAEGLPCRQAPQALPGNIRGRGGRGGRALLLLKEPEERGAGKNGWRAQGRGGWALDTSGPQAHGTCPTHPLPCAGSCVCIARARRLAWSAAAGAFTWLLPPAAAAPPAAWAWSPRQPSRPGWEGGREGRRGEGRGRVSGGTGTQLGGS